MLGAWRASRAAVGAAAVVLLLAACGPAEPSEQVAGSTCAGSTNAAGLTNLFDQIPGGMFAADYQRAVPLPDGRTLWLFQDASITLPPPPPPPEPPPLPLPGTPPPPPVVPATRLVHNAALLQTGTCFDLLRSGTDDAPGPWLFPAETAPFSHWFWPLDATVGQDGRLYVFVAEMVERGPLYLSTTEPIATRVVAVDLATMTPVAAGLAPNASASLYGFSIASAATWTYLYSQCHRQFGWSPSILLLAHDLSCSSNVTVARVPKGQVLQSPSYWDGATWQPDAA